MLPMKIIKTLQGQCFADIALITTGIADNATPIALANGASPTDDIMPGTIINIPDDLPSDVRTTNFFQAYARPATDPHVLPNGLRATYGTIGNMTIGNNFIVANSDDSNRP